MEPKNNNCGCSEIASVRPECEQIEKKREEFAVQKDHQTELKAANAADSVASMNVVQ